MAAAVGDRYSGSASVVPPGATIAAPATWDRAAPLAVLVLAGAQPPSVKDLDAVRRQFPDRPVRVWVALLGEPDPVAWRDFDEKLDAREEAGGTEQILVAGGEDPALSLALWALAKGSLPVTALPALTDDAGRTCRCVLLAAAVVPAGDDDRGERDAVEATPGEAWDDEVWTARSTVRADASAEVVAELAELVPAVELAQGQTARDEAREALVAQGRRTSEIAERVAQRFDLPPQLVHGLDRQQQAEGAARMAGLAAEPDDASAESAASYVRLAMACDRASEEEQQGFWARISGGKERRRAASAAVQQSLNDYLQAQAELAAEVAERALAERLASDLLAAAERPRTAQGTERSAVAVALWDQIERIRSGLALPAIPGGPGGFGAVKAYAPDSSTRQRCHVVLDPQRPGARELLDQARSEVPGPDDPEFQPGVPGDGSVVFVSRQGLPLGALLPH